MKRFHTPLSVILLMILLGFVAPSLVSQEFNDLLPLTEIKVQRTIDWEEALIHLDIKVPISQERQIFPINRINTEKFALDNLGQIIQKNLLSIQLDSRETLGEYLQKNPQLILSLRNAYKNVWRSYSRVSSDFQNLSIRYSLPIYPNLAEILTKHRLAYETPIFLDNNTNQESFTGLVIYVNKSLPLAQSFGRGQFIPSLFPKIYDENLNLFFEKEMVLPDYIKKWGVVTYTNDPLLRLHRDRVGVKPLYLSARALYGIKPTDLVISNKDIQTLVSVKNSKHLLKEGRVVIVLEEWPSSYESYELLSIKEIS